MYADGVTVYVSNSKELAMRQALLELVSHSPKVPRLTHKDPHLLIGREHTRITTQGSVLFPMRRIKICSLKNMRRHSALLATKEKTLKQ